MIFRISAIALGVALLAGCQTTTSKDPAPAQPAAPAPYMTPKLSQDGIFENREPDTCHAANFKSALGQPSSIISTLGLKQPISVVEWRGIEPPEYNPERIVFRLDQSGKIFNIDCG